MRSRLPQAVVQLAETTALVAALFAVGAYATRLIRGGIRADQGRWSAVGRVAPRLRRRRLLGFGVRQSKSLVPVGLEHCRILGIGMRTARLGAHNNTWAGC